MGGLHVVRQGVMIGEDEAWRWLVAEIVALALEESRDPDARTFLESSWCADLVEHIGGCGREAFRDAVRDPKKLAAIRRRMRRMRL